MIESFKNFGGAKFTLVNKTAIPANLHGCGMVTINNNNASVISYSESNANLGAAYAAIQESVKS